MFHKLTRLLRQLPAISTVAAFIVGAKQEQDAAARARISAIDVELADLERREEAAEIGIRSLAEMPPRDQPSDGGFFDLMK